MVLPTLRMSSSYVHTLIKFKDEDTSDKIDYCNILGLYQLWTS